MMAPDIRSGLARLKRMERRLQALEDAEASRNLKARYAALCDDQYDADGIAALFTEDALWESPALGRFEGREASRGFFRGASANGLAGFHGPTSSGSAAFAAHRLNLADMAESL